MQQRFAFGLGFAAVLATSSAFGQTSPSTNKLVCAITDAKQCVAFRACERVSPKEINISPLVTIDVKKKEIASKVMDKPIRTESIEAVRTTDTAIFLHGEQGDNVWSATIYLNDGTLTASVSGLGISFALFGKCAPN